MRLKSMATAVTLLLLLVAPSRAQQAPVGPVVEDFTEEKLAKMLPIRICLEQLAVRGAITRMTDRDAAELKKMAAHLRESLLDLEQLAASDIALHRKIWAIAGNDELEKILRAQEPLETKCRRFIDAARAAGAPDNVTAVLLRRN